MTPEHSWGIPTDASAVMATHPFLWPAICNRDSMFGGELLVSSPPASVGGHLLGAGEYKMVMMACASDRLKAAA